MPILNLKNVYINDSISWAKVVNKHEKRKPSYTMSPEEEYDIFEEVTKKNAERD